MANALMLVDIQNDFLPKRGSNPEGKLVVPHGDEIIEPIIKIMNSEKFDYIIATQDWHPYNHVSFASSYKGKKPFDKVIINNRTQILWPDHCVQGTYGAKICEELPQEKIDFILRKGFKKDIDSYSAFKNNWNALNERQTTGLSGFLYTLNVNQLYICGLARDICVNRTVIDVITSGFDITIIWDCCCSIDIKKDSLLKEQWQLLDVNIINSDQILGV